MKELREHNENMLRNILPSHVARHFLEKDRDNEVHTKPCHTAQMNSFSDEKCLQQYYRMTITSDWLETSLSS